MFGRDWEEAEATVVAVKDLSSWTSDPNSAITQSRPHEYVVDVRPTGEAPFRATFRDPYLRGHMSHPDEGQVIRVLFHPKSHEVKLIADDWKGPSDRALKDAETARFDAAAHGSPGEAAPSMADGSAGERLIEPEG